MGLAHAFELTDGIENAVQLQRRVAAQHRHEIKGAGDGGQLFQFHQFRHLGLNLGPGLWQHRDAHERRYPRMLRAAQAHSIARNRAGFFEPRDARQHRRSRQPEASRQKRRRLTRVGLQQGHQFAIDRVEIGCL